MQPDDAMRPAYHFSRRLVKLVGDLKSGIARHLAQSHLQPPDAGATIAATHRIKPARKMREMAEVVISSFFKIQEALKLANGPRVGGAINWIDAIDLQEADGAL